MEDATTARDEVPRTHSNDLVSWRFCPRFKWSQSHPQRTRERPPR